MKAEQSRRTLAIWLFSVCALIALMVVVDEPQPLHTGGQVAAPVFREIAEQAVRYLDIPPVPAEQAWAFGDRIPQWES